ncbi:MAG: hypothetical protein ACJAQT_002370 [Akkermansiaceae bacterium]|jgi:hypothetical protein
MLSPQQILDTYYLEARRDLLEIAALLDRYDAAVEREATPITDENAKLTMMRQALSQLSETNSPSTTRTADLLELFATLKA